MPGPRPANKRCRHGCHFSSPVGCKNDTDRCVCGTCNGRCQGDSEDGGEDSGEEGGQDSGVQGSEEGGEEGSEHADYHLGCDACCDPDKVCQACPCCGDLHEGPVKFGTVEEKTDFHTDPLECSHCMRVLYDADSPAGSTVLDLGISCEYHHQLEAYNKAELLRTQKASDRQVAIKDESKGKDVSRDETGGKDASKAESSGKRERAQGGAAGESSADKSRKVAPPLAVAPPLVVAPPLDKGVIVISSDEEPANDSDDVQVVAPARIRGISSSKRRIRRS